MDREHRAVHELAIHWVAAQLRTRRTLLPRHLRGRLLHTYLRRGRIFEANRLARRALNDRHYSCFARSWRISATSSRALTAVEGQESGLI